MTLNIWNYTQPWNERRSLIADLILQTDPDVVCLQEVRHDFRFERGTGQGEQIAQRTGWHLTSRVAQVYWPFPRVDEGLAILTRTPPDRVMVKELRQLRDEREDENHRVCLGIATRTTGGDEIHVFNTHFSLGAAARLVNSRETFQFVRESGDVPALLFGDLNCEPDSEPIQFLTGRLEIDGESGEFVDCWSAVHPHDLGYTYGTSQPVRRIDYALGRNLGDRSMELQVIGTEARNGIYPSDHMGIVIDVDL